MKKIIKNTSANFDKVKVANEKLKAIKGGINTDWIKEKNFAALLIS